MRWKGRKKLGETPKQCVYTRTLEGEGREEEKLEVHASLLSWKSMGGVRLGDTPQEGPGGL